ncbi:hypothetical protein CROQUDRAFT_712662 [Cronartium quercuum f. sp. fusiforme G11]|uniref:Uncharacterized protein n=1 Tax=Cronartium quercuum f. sp. fusiforme G11 TaxID=708437 RepID=A0A9P6NT05_9BASI|nr:hypothetical protein CROQUDRAFT_712662 [Cronartium quercuum f. sp. fusiforme G11]
MKSLSFVLILSLISSGLVQPNPNAKSGSHKKGVIDVCNPHKIDWMNVKVKSCRKHFAGQPEFTMTLDGDDRIGCYMTAVEILKRFDKAVAICNSMYADFWLEAKSGANLTIPPKQITLSMLRASAFQTVLDECDIDFTNTSVASDPDWNKEGIPESYTLQISQPSYKRVQDNACVAGIPGGKGKLTPVNPNS